MDIREAETIDALDRGRLSQARKRLLFRCNTPVLFINGYFMTITELEEKVSEKHGTDIVVELAEAKADTEGTDADYMIALIDLLEHGDKLLK